MVAKLISSTIHPTAVPAVQPAPTTMVPWYVAAEAAHQAQQAGAALLDVDPARRWRGRPAVVRGVQRLLELVRAGVIRAVFNVARPKPH